MKLHTFCNDNLRHRLMALQSNTALCDFTFKLHDSTQFSTHKAVVAAFSTTALMLCDETGQVVIPRHDITRDIFQIVLNFIYGQSVVVKDTYMKQLEWLANYLGIEDLSKLLVPFKSLTSNSDVCIEIKEEPIELNDELDVQESTSAMLHNAVFSDTYADDNDIKDEDNEHSAILTKQRQKRHKTSKGKAKTKSSKKRKTDDTSKIKSDNANKELADDENDDTDIDKEDDMNDEMDTGESASNEINDNIENVTTKQEPADSEQVGEPSTSANADQVEDDTKQHMDTKHKTSQWEQEEDEKHAGETTEEKNTENVESNKVAEIRHRCDIDQCTYTAKYKYLVNQHKKITHDGLRYHCEKCSKRFTRKHILEDHINVVHLKIQSFLCQLCSKAYSSMSSLTTHVKYKHEMVKHFTCCICKKGYFHKNDYESHMNNHSKVTPYQCKLCKKEFQIRNSFRNHQVDCGRKSEDKYKCEECQKYFSTNRSLSEHIKFQHRQINLFQCCGKTYKYPRSYRRHLKSNQHIDK